MTSLAILSFERRFDHVQQLVAAKGLVQHSLRVPPRLARFDNRISWILSEANHQHQGHFAQQL
ncbi:MAG: hypothetical protein NTY19_15250 [Planctomycetota bacterium]|nr:hypothetical protein [Planctomycetota bacterium]